MELSLIGPALTDGFGSDDAAAADDDELDFALYLAFSCFFLKKIQNVSCAPKTEGILYMLHS